MNSLKHFWRLLCYSLGSKSGKNNREADLVAIIRLFFVFQVFITNIFIVIGVIRHFNDNQIQKQSSITLNFYQKC